jgi:transposase InsO family protein
MTADAHPAAGVRVTLLVGALVRRRRGSSAGRDELLNSWRFDSLLEARVIIDDWRCDYNANRPHTAHGELTPIEFALQWTTTQAA